MSKSLGNVVDPLAMKDQLGVDALRYFLLRDMSSGRTRILLRSWQLPVTMEI